VFLQIGWRGFGREYVNNGSLGWKVLNTMYPVFIVMLLFYTYGYEIIACQWKLNVEIDTQVRFVDDFVNSSPLQFVVTNCVIVVK